MCNQDLLLFTHFIYKLYLCELNKSWICYTFCTLFYHTNLLQSQQGETSNILTLRNIKHARWLALKIITYWSRVYRVWLQRQYLLSISASHRPEWQKWAPATLINILLRHEYFGLFVPRSCSISAAVAAAWREHVQSKD